MSSATYSQIKEKFPHLFPQDGFILDFDIIESHSNNWEKIRQLEYWISILLDRLEKLPLDKTAVRYDHYVEDIADLWFAERKHPVTEFDRLHFKMAFISQTAMYWNDEPMGRNSVPDLIKADLPQDKTLYEKIYDNVRLIWADPDFWELHHQSDDILETLEKIKGYIAKRYGMEFSFPPVVWQQMVVKPYHRNYFVNLMTLFPRDYFLLGSPHASKAGVPESERLENNPYMDILQTHLEKPKLDLRGYLAACALPKYALEDLVDLGKELIKNATWCLKTENQYVEQESTNPQKRPLSWDRAMEREKLVELIKSDPTLATKPSRLAHAHFGISDPKEHKSAQQAIRLFKYREYFDSKNKYKGWDI